MLNYFVNEDAWLSALIFAGLMLVGWAVGLKLRPAKGTEGASTRVEDGALALLGLLLAFCFSGAAGRYEARKALLGDDVIAIAEFADVSSTLAQPERGELRQEIQKYAQQRIVFGKTRLDAPQMPGIIKAGRDSQARMLTLIDRTISEQKTPSIYTPLLNAYNGLVAAHDKRLYGVRNQVNGSIILMLALLGVFTTFNMGRLQEPATRHGLLRIASYAGLIALVFYVTVDMEQPRRGLMLVDQGPMQELVDTLKSQNP